MWDVSRIHLVLAALLCAFFLSGCEDQGTITEDGGSEAEWPAPPRDPGTYSCDPFVDPDTGLPTPGAGVTDQSGLIGQLYYLPPDLPHYPSVDDYIDNGTKVDEFDIFFNQLYVPTRPFDRGFITAAGVTLMTPEGDTLYEWFALDFTGKIQLRADQPAGYYQFATLSDDGSILEMDVDGDGSFEMIIDNDGWHPTKMGCPVGAIYLDENSQIDFRLKYFQGPRYHISMILMMREQPVDVNLQVDVSCGLQGNSRYFDYTQSPPEPKQAYLDLFDRGWSVVSPENYLLPGEDMENPCNAPAPVITNWNVSGITKTEATVTWTTDIAASSQVEITEVLTGVKTLTTELNLGLTNHSVTITGLKSNTLYSVLAISKSSSRLEDRSDPISFRTLR